MSDQIKLSIPYKYLAVSQAADFLHNLALDLNQDAHPGPAIPFPNQEADERKRCEEAFDEGCGFSATKENNTEVDPGPAAAPPPPAAGDDDTGTTAPPPPATVELDTTGLPWDGRIHASTRAVLKSGAWKRKRGVDAETVAAIEAELKGVQEIPAPEATTDTPTFPDFMMQLTASDVTPERVDEVCKSHGFASLPLLATRPELIPAVMADLFGGAE